MSYFPIHNHYHMPRLREMGRVFWCHSIGSAGISLVAIFVPIFLLKSGYSFREVLVYMCLQQLFSLLLQWPVAKSFEFISPHRQMALGSVYFAIMFALLASLDTYNWPLFYIAIVWALNRTTYWTAFHYVFSLARGHKAGKQIAGIAVLTTLSTTVAPAIGGIVATVFGINYIYFAAIALLIIALLPMLDNSGPSTVKVTLPRTEFKKIRRDMFAQACNGTVYMTEAYVWPIFVYLVVATYAGIGALSSVIALASILITLHVGRRQDAGKGVPYLKRGLRAYSITSIGRVVAQNSAQIFGLNMLAGIGRSLYVTPFLDRYYHHSDNQYRLGYISAMEGSFIVGALLFTSMLLLFSFFLSTGMVLSIGFGIVALSAFGVNAMRDTPSA